MVVRSQSGRALANLDRDGEKGHTYEDGIFVVYPVKQLKWYAWSLDTTLRFITNHG